MVDKDPSKRLKSDFFEHGSSSWTDVLPQTEHVDLFRQADYAHTVLGPLSTWGPALRFYTTMIFADSRAACLYWGKDHLAIYNEKAAVLMAEAHPQMLGRPLKDVLPEVAVSLDHTFEAAVASGQTVDVDNILLFLERSGYAEEAYFIGQFIPLRGDNGEIEGVYNTILESTAQVLHERRRKVVESIVAIPPCPVDDTLFRVVEALKINPLDITMALLYSFDEDSTSGAHRVLLRASILDPQDHRCAPTSANLRTDDSGVVPYLRRAKETGAPVVLSTDDGSLKATGELFEGVTWSGYGEPSRTVVVMPLSSGGRTLGFYVQGINPRRAYDRATEISIAELSRSIEAKWVSSISAEEARVRHEMLEHRLTESERRLWHTAQSAPFGMCQIVPDDGGVIQWANDQFYEITGHDRTKPAMSDFMNIVAPEDRERAFADLGTLFEKEAARVTSELRLTRKWSPPAEENGAAVDDTAWMLTTGFSVFEAGKPKLLMGYVYDISQQKWAESVQSHHAAETLDAKRRQDEFIDVTSHEMRNPLTAIVQLADGISQSLKDINDADTTRKMYHEVALSNVESSNTILACAAHLQRVIDDVLMLSRLESDMLSITPVVARPTDVLSNTIKMYDGEIRLHETEIEIVSDDSYDKLQVDYVLCDTSRLVQVLINLISNAIKFTAPRVERKVSLVYGAQRRRPPAIRTAFGDLKWMALPDGQPENPALPALDPGEEPLYLYFCVQDTGPGVTPEEMERLFKRFSQANSKTHISYGGSGLGLYICRELAEKQGGGVGVASRPNEGSVFGFYIETRHAKAPDDMDTPGAPRHIAQRLTTLSIDRPDLPQRLNSTIDVPKADGHHTDVMSGTQPPVKLRESAQKLCILLVEDNIINQKILAKQLRSAKCSVTVANNGAEALEVIRKTNRWRDCDQAADECPPIDVVLMDWEMPVMNGLECSKRIRELELEGQLTRRLPIIAITANVRQEQQEQAVAAGMDNVMPKPFSVSDLLTRIRDTIADQKNKRQPKEAATTL